ncbi:hypothetical protein BT96DRAFT_950852 [Gymnopus androsaceus JB14]|uniref:Uncharacterized protein n=1 Tax=Gymnopus androsaceus JB14 TaxID=1447944 RepID=A0A6A4GEQ8_9AGAR|nr:hypothetical protein BT96DRAFT_950852 [Gymnopus androsaceus JB14]
MPSSTNPCLIASSRTAAAPYPPTIAGSLDTDNEVKKTCGHRCKVKSQAPKEIPPHPNQEEFQALKEKAENRTIFSHVLPAKGPHSSHRADCGHVHCAKCTQIRRSSAIRKANFHSFTMGTVEEEESVKELRIVLSEAPKLQCLAQTCPDLKLMILQFNPLRTGRGWVNVMESALKLIRQNMELSQPSLGAMTPYQPQALLPDSSTAIKSIFLSIGNLLKRTDIQNILLNINFAAIHIALLRAGIMEYQSTYEAFRKDIDMAFKQTDLDWGSLETFKDNYKTGLTFQLPLHLALAISPIMLLCKVQLWSLSVNREHLFTIARGLGPNPPTLLQQINRAMWRDLIKISEGTMTAHGLLYDLYQEFSAEDLQSVSDVDAQFFYPASTPNLVQESASSDRNLQHAPDPPLVAASSPPAVSSAPAASSAQHASMAHSDFLSSTSLVNALNLAEAANIQTMLDAGECLQLNPRKEESSVVSSRSSGTISTPIKPQAQTPPSTLATSLTEDVLMAGPVEIPNQVYQKIGTASSKPKRKLSDVEVPDFEPKPAPQAQNAYHEEEERPQGYSQKKPIKKATVQKSKEGIESEEEEEEGIGSMVESEEDVKLAIVKLDEDQSVGHSYVLNTDRPRSTRRPVDVYSHDGKSVFHFQPSLFSNAQHELLSSLIIRVNLQAGRVICDDSVSVNKWVDLTTPVPAPHPSPVYETTYQEWLELSSSHQQSIFKTQNILL